MTVKECYEQMGSDYEGVLGRMGSEAMIKRFALKFLQDPSFNNLKENLEKNDGEEAFRAAHTYVPESRRKIPEDSQRNQRFRVTSALPQAKGDTLRE